MAELRKRIEWEIAGKADAYRRVLEQLPGETAASARKSADAWAAAQARVLAKQEAGIVSSAKRQADAWGEVGKKVAELAGGPFSRLGQVIFDLAPKAATAGGSVVAGLGGAATTVGALWAGALAGVVAGIVGLTKAGVSAEERLVRAGRAAEIPEGARRSLALYRQEAEDLGRAWDVAIATAGGAAANVGRGAVATFTEWARAVEHVRTGAMGLAPMWAGLSDKLVELRSIAALSTLGLSELVLRWHEVGAAATEAADLQQRASKLHLDQIQAEAEAEDAARRDNARRAAELLKQRAAEEAAERKRRIAESAAAAKHEREAQEREAQRYQDFLAGLRRDTAEREARATSEGLGRLIEDIDARLEAQRAYEEQVAEIRVRAIDEGLDATIAAIDEQLVAIKHAQAAASENWSSAAGSGIDAMQTLASAWTDAVEEGTANQIRAAAVFARFVKKTTIAASVLQGIQAVGAAAASAPPPFNVPAILAAAADAAARTAAAVAAPVPSAFAGSRSSPGESLERRHAGESTLTAPATEQIVRLLNDRLSPLASLPGALAGAGGGGDVYLDGRRVGRVVSGGRRSPPPGYRVSRR